MTKEEAEAYTGGMDCDCHGADTLVDIECRNDGNFDGLCRMICEGSTGARYSLPLGHPLQCKCRLGVLRDPETETFVEDDEGHAWGFAACKDPADMPKGPAGGGNTIIWIAAGLAAAGALFYFVRK